MNIPAWCGPPIFGGDWIELEGAEALTLAYEIGAATGGRDDLTTDARIELLRVRDIACYPGAMLIEAQALVGERRGLSNHLYGPWGLVTLDGSSAVLHNLNETEGTLSLETEAQVRDYQLLFCNTVRGGDGRFQIATMPEPLPWLPGAAPDDAVLATISHPIRLSRNAEGGWKSEAPVLYGTTLFYAKFQIAPNGMMEMVDDEPVDQVEVLPEDWGTPYRFPAGGTQ
jgi:hypothetical protein